MTTGRINQVTTYEGHTAKPPEDGRVSPTCGRTAAGTRPERSGDVPPHQTGPGPSDSHSRDDDARPSTRRRPRRTRFESEPSESSTGPRSALIHTERTRGSPREGNH